MQETFGHDIGDWAEIERIAKRMIDELMPAIRADGKRGAAVRYFMCDVIGMPKFIGWLFALFPMWSKLKAVAHTLPYDLTIMADVAALDRARSTNVPTLIGGGAKSPLALKAAVEKVAAAIPGARIRWVEGQTHNLAAAPAVAMMREFFL